MGEQILKYLIDVVFGLFTYALLLRFVMQAMRAPFRNPLGQAVIALTDWIVKPLRRVLPGYKGLDWASLVATVLFQFLWVLAIRLVFGGFGFTGDGFVFLLVRTVVELVRAIAVAVHRGRDRAGDPVVGRARRSAVGLAQRAHVSVPARRSARCCRRSAARSTCRRSWSSCSRRSCSCCSAISRTG